MVSLLLFAACTCIADGVEDNTAEWEDMNSVGIADVFEGNTAELEDMMNTVGLDEENGKGAETFELPLSAARTKHPIILLPGFTGSSLEHQ